MAEKFVSEKNLKFLLYDVFDIERLTGFPFYEPHNRKLFDMVLDAAHRLARDRFRPLLEEMDKRQPEWVSGVVKVHPDVGGLMAEMGEGGWIGATFPADRGGEQLPLTLSAACRFIFAAANYSASVYPELTAGAAHLITAFGNSGLVEMFVPKMLAGKWQGTMALTEPQAGSSLSDILTTAEFVADGVYKIKGHKIFITAGDHDGAKNVIHLMLAKIEGAPPGVKGISLFVVPKLRTESGGRLVSNDVTVSQIYHKLGYRGAPATELVMGEKDDCLGHLVGAPHNGLLYMFQMMNEARLGVGLGAAAIASAAYYAALAYTRERRQGRRLANKDPGTLQIPIIEHPDVKRMLLLQRTIVEGALSLLLQCHYYADMEKVTHGDDRTRYRLLLDILTPVAKSYPSEMGCLAVSNGLQCFGGYGYCEDFPMEQYYRDARIHPIHEGTTGIQGLDLLGRKVVMDDGKAFLLFLEEMEKTVVDAENLPEMSFSAEKLRQAAERLKRVTAYLVETGLQKGPEVFLADAALYLELFGITAIAWQWLLQGAAAQRALAEKPSKRDAMFYQGKRTACRFFFLYELPKTMGLAERLTDGKPLTVGIDASTFSD